MATVPNGTASTSAAVISAPRIQDRWETAFVYAFIVKFTGNQLRGKVDGFETPMDFEQALVHDGPHVIIEQILCKFISNLRPNSKNITPSQISKHLTSLFEEYNKQSERTLFWDENIHKNTDPLAGTGGFFTQPWETKLLILRQLIEWQLTHSSHVKSIIDVAWGVRAYKHKKKVDGDPNAPPPAEDPNSMTSLSLTPVGQDGKRQRYWIFDDSPRIYISQNPWKSSSPFVAAASSREEVVQLIEDLKLSVPSEEDQSIRYGWHTDLLSNLETDFLPKVEIALARIAKSRKKVEQKNILLAQAEIRSTRTRRQTRRPDYVYGDLEGEDNDDQDDYKYTPDLDDEVWEDGDEEFGVRRSSRAAANGRRRGEQSANEWRGERRSSRLVGNAELVDERPRKRTRLSSVSSSAPPEVEASSASIGDGSRARQSGTTVVKPTEVVLDSIPGKKRSKFWFYAVEPIPGPTPGVVPNSSAQPLPAQSLSHTNGTGNRQGNSEGTEPSVATTTTTASDVEMQSESSLSDVDESM